MENFLQFFMYNILSRCGGRSRMPSSSQYHVQEPVIVILFLSPMSFIYLDSDSDFKFFEVL